MHPTSPQEISIKLFISYADAEKDEKLVEEFEKHLSGWRQPGLIHIWSKRKIGAGKDWLKETEKHLRAADIILLMISPDFIDSDNLYNNELRRAVEQYELEEATVIPIILRSVYWEGTLFGKFECLPENRSAVTSRDWIHTDEAFHNISNSLGDIIRGKIEKKRQEYQDKLDYYRQKYQRMRRRSIFLDDSKREQLVQVKYELKLQDDDVSEIESSYTVVDVAWDYLRPIVLLVRLLFGGLALLQSISGFSNNLIVLLVILGIIYFNRVPYIDSPNPSPKVKHPTVSTDQNLPKEEVEPPSIPVNPPLSKEKAIELVRKFLQAKPKIFGKSYDLETAKKITGDEKYKKIQSAIDGIDGIGGMREEGGYIEFSKELIIGFDGLFCSVGSKAEIHLKVEQSYVGYTGGLVYRNAPPYRDQSVFGLQYIDNTWKLVDEAIASDVGSLTDFRKRFWKGKSPC